MLSRSLMFALLLPPLLFSCSDTLPNEEGYLVDKLRILAVKSTPPEIGPGARGYLQSLVLDPKGNGRALTYTWLACDPQVDNFYDTICSDQDRLADLEGLANDPLVHSLGTDTAATYFASADVFAGLDVSDPRRLLGVPAEILLIVSAGSFEDAAANKVEHQVALYDLNISGLPSTEQNQNPAIVDTTANVNLNANVSCASAQQYAEIDPTLAAGYRLRYEALEATWFTTGGDIIEPDTLGHAATNCPQSALYGASATLSITSPVTVAVVVRDGRGGLDFKMFPVTP